MMFAPLEGWRHVEVTDRHTAVDFAHLLRDLSDTHFPQAKKIVLMEDNLSTHKPASLYEAFPAAEARRLEFRVAIGCIHPDSRQWLCRTTRMPAQIIVTGCRGRLVTHVTHLHWPAPGSTYSLGFVPSGTQPAGSPARRYGCVWSTCESSKDSGFLGCSRTPILVASELCETSELTRFVCVSTLEPPPPGAVPRARGLPDAFEPVEPA